MRRTIVAAIAMLTTLILARPSLASPMTYLSLGDSVAFGETDFTKNPSFGNRGYVSDYAGYLASQNGGVSPTVKNMAIDGETTLSFFTGVGRVGPQSGISDQTLASWNKNYTTNPDVTQNQKLIQAVGAAHAAGRDVGVVTISLGANDLFTLVKSPGFLTASPAEQQMQLAHVIQMVGNDYSVILSEIHALAPNAKVFALGEYNPFPADPTNPLTPFAKIAVQALNAAIQGVAQSSGVNYVDTYTPFVGHESQYTYITTIPGDVHPNKLGYSVIAGQIEAVPEPSCLAVMGAGIVAIAVARRRRRSAG